MKTFLVKRNENNELTIKGFILAEDLRVLVQKIERNKIKLPRRGWKEVALFDHDYN